MTCYNPTISNAILGNENMRKLPVPVRFLAVFVIAAVFVTTAVGSSAPAVAYARDTQAAHRPSQAALQASGFTFTVPDNQTVTRGFFTPITGVLQNSLGVTVTFNFQVQPVAGGPAVDTDISSVVVPDGQSADVSLR